MQQPARQAGRSIEIEPSLRNPTPAEYAAQRSHTRRPVACEMN